MSEEAVRDPVCGELVDDEQLKSTYRGTDYYFCSEICKRKFEQDPQTYLSIAPESEFDYDSIRFYFWAFIGSSLLSNLIGLLLLYVYIMIVFGQGFITKILEVGTVLVPVSLIIGAFVTYHYLGPVIRFFSPFNDNKTLADVDDTVRTNLLNAPVILSLIIYGLWILIGSMASLYFMVTEIRNFWVWFFHVFGSNFFSGSVVTISVFYISERMLSRWVIPPVMGSRKVSELEGVIPVPIWFRIIVLIMTAAVFPMLHVFALNWLGNPSLKLIVFFIVMIVAVALFQAIYILRSISFPIGKIADQFESLQHERSLPRHQKIYRADNLGRFAEMFDDLVETMHERDFLQRTFGRYVSDQVMNRIMAGQIELGGERYEGTVLFADVRDFTSLSERKKPEEIVQLLNKYFERMVDAITENEGIPDKFMGDGLLAVWGVPIQTEHHEEQAVRGALDMFDALEEFNHDRRESDEEPLSVGIAIHSGELVGGNIGSSKKMDFTVIGDTVNTCSKIESMNKELGKRLTISESVYEGLPTDQQDLFSRNRELEIEGKTDTVTVYSLDNGQDGD